MTEEIMIIEECAKYHKTSVSTIYIDLPKKVKSLLLKWEINGHFKKRKLMNGLKKAVI